MVDVDVLQLGFVGLMAMGTVNVLSFFVTDLTSAQKFAISAVAAFIFAFVPADLANELANQIKDALAIALAGSGGYKLASKAGGS